MVAVAVGMSGAPRPRSRGQYVTAVVDGFDLALTLLDHRLQILVEDFLLLVGNLQKTLVDGLELLICKRVAQLGEAMAQCRVTRARRKDNLGTGGSHVFGVDNLVGITRLEHAVLMDARAVGKGVGAHDGFVGLHVNAGNG